MKKKLLALLPVLLLGLAACNNGKSSSSSGEGGDSGLPDSKDAVVIFYLDYNHADENNPYFQADWYFGVPLNRDELVDKDGNKLVDPTDDKASYTEFNHFLGWSLHPVVDSEDDLWDWEHDTKEKDDRGKYLQLYGVWVEKTA